MDLIHAMRIFSRIAETESFTRAAEQLDLSVPTVTRGIASLEAHLNVQLLNRTTRRVALTDVGQSYLEGCRAALEQIDDAEKNVARATHETQGSLRILAGSPFSLARLAPVLTTYRKKYPHIQVQLTMSDREVDLFEERIDAAVLADYMLKSESLIVRQLLTYNQVAVASPAYLRKTGLPQLPVELKRLAFIGRPENLHGYTLTLTADNTGNDEDFVHLTPIFTCNNPMMLHQLVLEGMGFAILPTAFVEADLKSGSLIQLLKPRGVSGGNVTICLVYPSRKYVNRKLRTFIDHLTEAFVDSRSISV